MSRTHSNSIVTSLITIAICTCAASGDEKLIAAFTSDSDLSLWQVRQATAQLAPEHATEGKQSMKVTFSGKLGDWPGISTRNKQFFKDWDHYAQLKFDVFNPSNETFTMGLRIDDVESTTDDYTTYFYWGMKVLPGENTFTLELNQLYTAKAVRRIPPGRVTRVALAVPYSKLDRNVDTVVFIDNFRLVSTESSELPEGFLGIDFGTWNSLVWPGFNRGSRANGYSRKGSSFGWKRLKLRRDRDFLLPDALGRDCVEVWGDKNILGVNLSPGKYKVWMLLGQLAGRDLLKMPHEIIVEGKRAHKCDQKHAAYLDILDPLAFEYRKDNPSLWDLFVTHNYEEVTFEVDCPDGVMDFKFKASTAEPIYLSAIAIWPADKTECEAVIERINAKRRKNYETLMREIRPIVLPDVPELTDNEKRRGFVLTSPDYLKDLSPYYIPAADQRVEKFSIAACRDEYEPALLVVYPLWDQRIDVSVSDLNGPDAQTIRASSISIERAVYRYTSPERGLATYIIMPWHLVESAGVKAEAYLPQQFWVTVKVPGDARPGKYTGTVTVKGQTGSAELPFELEVYPFELEKPDATYAHPYNIPDDPNRIEMDLDCMVRYGSNSLTPGIPSGKPTKVDGRLQVDFTRDNMFMEKVRDAGMIGPIPLFNMSIQGQAGGKSFSHMRFERQFSYKLTDQQYLDDLTALTKLIVANAKANNWLPMIMYPSTEISSDRRLGPQFNRKLIHAIRAGGEGVRTVSSINRPKDLESVKDLDVVMYNEAVGINTESILAARAEGCDLWFQNIGAGRFNEGLYLLRTGAVGRRQWAMNWYLGNPYCDMYYSSYYRGMQPNTNFLIFPTKTKTIGSIGLARMREGVDDYRYFQTLRSAIAAAMKSGSAARVALAGQVQKQYDVMVASAPITPQGSYRPGLKPRKVEGENFESQKLLDDYRRRAAELIMQLNGSD